MRGIGRTHSIHRVLVSLALLCSLSPASGALASRTGTQPVAKKKALPPGLVGAWRLVKDDTAPGKTLAGEVITFSADGTWRVTEAGEPFGGRCRVERQELVMMLVMGGKAEVRRRVFKLDAEGLHFANSQGGYQHYVRVKK